MEIKTENKSLIKIRERVKALMEIKSPTKNLMETKQAGRLLMKIKEEGKCLIKVKERERSLIEIREGGNATNPADHRPPSKLPPSPAGFFENLDFLPLTRVLAYLFFLDYENKGYLCGNKQQKPVPNCSIGDGGNIFQLIIKRDQDQCRT